MKLFQINFQISDTIFIKSNSDSFEFSDHWYEIKDKVKLIPYTSLLRAKKMEILIYNKERIPSIIIPTSMLEFVRNIKVKIEINIQI